MTSAAKIEANRRNARKSTGPRTRQGKERSRWNATKHGMAAQMPVLPGEDATLYRRRLESWVANFQPRNDVEYFFAEQAARLAWRLERLDRAHTAHLAYQMRTGAAEQRFRDRAAAADLGERLFSDPRGHLATYPHAEYTAGLPRISWSGIPHDPSHPSRIVRELESTRAGCRWLMAAWAELRSSLERKIAWFAPQRFKAFRLLGKQPMDAVDDPELTTITLACHVIDARSGEPFRELFHDLLPEEGSACKQELTARQVEELRPADAAAALKILVDLVDRETARLKKLEKYHRRKGKVAAGMNRDRQAFDQSPDGEKLRRYEATCWKNLHRIMQMMKGDRRGLTNSGGGAGATPFHVSSSLCTDETDLLSEEDLRFLRGEDEFDDDFDDADAGTLLDSQPAEADEPILQNEANAAAGPAAQAQSQKQPETRVEEMIGAALERIRHNEPTAPSAASPQRQTIGHSAHGKHRGTRAKRRAEAQRVIDQMNKHSAALGRSAMPMHGVSLGSGR